MATIRTMTGGQREVVGQLVKEAYGQGLYTYAYYLELCLKVNEAPDGVRLDINPEAEATRERYRSRRE